MIRDAKVTDFAAIVAMGRKFHAAADAGDIPPFDELSFRRTASWLMQSPTGVLLVVGKDDSVHGMAGAIVYPAWFNLACNIAQEIFWWVEPVARGHKATALRWALETRMREMGAQAAVMASMAGMRDEAMARLYRMEGYRPMEHTFIKSLLQGNVRW